MNKTIELDLSELPNTPSADIGRTIYGMVYRCYKYNRDRSPDITPEQWKVVFDNVDLMELRYQKEQGGF